MKHRYSMMKGILLPLLALTFELSVPAEVSGFQQSPSQAATGNIVLRGLIENSKGEPIPGVTVRLSNNGNFSESASANTEGVFAFRHPSGTGPFTLRISHVGYIAQSFTRASFDPTKTESLHIVLKDSAADLNEVVVTALGIRREEKALGYAAQKVTSEDLTDARSNNFVNALSGKVAGLSLISPGSGPLNSVRVSLRGDASLNPNGNNALIVLDGVPMNNRINSSGVSNAYQAGSGADVPIDFGNGISDINPDDIESITVLKGPSATALYGSRAASGALIVTTKSGVRKGKGIGVTLNSNTSINNVIKWPDYQHEYGQGTGKQFNTDGEKYYSYGATTDGASTSGTSSAFGPKFNGQSYFQYDPSVEGPGATRTPWVAYDDNVKSFWRTGYTLANNIALEGGNDKGSSRVSLTHTKNEWMMPNTGFERINAAVSLNYKLSDKLNVSSKINFTNKRSDNLPATGYNNQSISYFMIFQNPNVNLQWYRPVWKNGQYQRQQIHPYSSFIDNPYLIAYEMTNSVRSNQVAGNIAATYHISPKFDVMVRTAVEMSMEHREQRRPFNSANFQSGYFKEQSIEYYEVNTDGLLTYHDQLGSDFGLNASVGANALVRRLNGVDSYVDGLVIPGVYMLANGIGQPVTVARAGDKNVNSVYGLASLHWRNKIFLDITGRNDWSSTLPKQNNSFFYPSVSTSIILSDLFNLPQQISFAKFRLGAAQVGNDTDPYNTRKYYNPSDFPGSAEVPGTLYNIDLKPEISSSIEAGLDVRFFDGRLGIDLTGYNNLTRNQILNTPLDPTAGYSGAFVNGGKVRNRGLELLLSGTPIKSKSFSWSTFITWSRNWNKVLELTEGFGNDQTIGIGGNATLIARVGGTTGDIYGFGFKRAPDGQIVYLPSGLPARPEEIQYIGNAYADWKGGIRNEFSYKNWRFSFLVDGQYGGIVYSQTHHKMTEQGKLKHTLKGREENFIIGDGVVLDADGKYVPNTKQVIPADFYADYWRRANVESNSFDASYLKLREARLEYSFPQKMLRKSFLQNVSLALYGRDLFMLTSFPMFDPETAALNGNTILPGIEMGQMPSQRTIGANITLKF